MRIAVAGKGGSGKTTIAGTIARLLARSGRSVLAIDADTNPNLAAILGMTPDAMQQISKGHMTFLVLDMLNDQRPRDTRPAGH